MTQYSGSVRALRALTAFCMFVHLFLMGPGLTLALGARRQTSGQTPPPAQPQATPPAGQQPPQPPPEKPFAEVVKDAEVIQGLFTFYRKDDKVYLEILPEQFDRNYLYAATLEAGIGERGFFAAQVLDDFVFTFRRLGKNVQFIQKNVRYRAADKTPMQRAVSRSFADSILGAAKFESQPHPERKSVLVDLGNFLLADVPLIGYFLEATYRLPYRLDRGNSALTMVKSFPQNAEVEAALNFAIERPMVPPPLPTPVPAAAPPLAPPDLRSLQFRMRYSLSALPPTSYRPRLADDRVGHFLTMHQDFSGDSQETPYVRFINRWHLEKADPGAPLSPPKPPIVFWLENTIPENYRQAVADGVLVWTGAFARIGIKDAIVVRQQPDDADWDPADVRYNTIRWFVATDAAFAIGPSRANPFTGQIYDADIGFTENLTRFARLEFKELVQPVATTLDDPGAPGMFMRHPYRFCNYADGAARQAAFGHGLLHARGLLANGAAEEQYVRDFLTHVTAHEVGHTLGLRHNFRASVLHGFDKLQDAAVTTASGLTGSVMDYTPVNIAPKGVKQGQHWQTTLGTYDYWAVEYAYKPVPASSPEGELAELRKIASRVADPTLAYGTDEDSFGTSPIGLDPRTNQWDIGGDPLQYAVERLKLVDELWQGLETKAAKPGEGYQVLRRAFNQGFGEMFINLLNASKYIGGIYHHRDHVGDPNGRLPYEPVPAARQRQALDILKTRAFGSQAFNFSPRLLNKLAIERFWTFEGEIFRASRLDYPIHQQVLGMQRVILDRLHHPIVLARLQDLEVKYLNPADAFTMADMFEGLRAAIWSEVKRPAAPQINSFRRAVQREHLRHLTRLVLRPAGNTPEDATTLARYSLTQLRAGLQQALASNRPNLATRAHLEESLARIDEALKAQQQRVVN